MRSSRRGTAGRLRVDEVRGGRGRRPPRPTWLTTSSPNCGQFRRTASTTSAMASTTSTVTVSAKYEPTSETSFQVGVRRSANHCATSRSPRPRRVPDHEVGDQRAERRAPRRRPPRTRRARCPAVATTGCTWLSDLVRFSRVSTVRVSPPTRPGKHEVNDVTSPEVDPARHPRPARARARPRCRASGSRCVGTPGSTRRRARPAMPSRTRIERTGRTPVDQQAGPEDGNRSAPDARARRARGRRLRARRARAPRALELEPPAHRPIGRTVGRGPHDVVRAIDARLRHVVRGHRA